MLVLAPGVPGSERSSVLSPAYELHATRDSLAIGIALVDLSPCPRTREGGALMMFSQPHQLSRLYHCVDLAFPVVVVPPARALMFDAGICECPRIALV